MKRTLYFLKDSVSGKFYSGQSIYLVDFKEAAIYFQEKNVIKRRKELVDKWKWHAGNIIFWKGDTDKKKWAKEIEGDVNARKSLPDWGIEVVSREIEA